jgi:hypothetical protein
MSYYQAKQCFDENSTLIGQPIDHHDKLLWNISVGLSHLTSTLQSDIEQIQHKLRQIQDQ